MLALLVDAALVAAGVCFGVVTVAYLRGRRELEQLRAWVVYLEGGSSGEGGTSTALRVTGKPDIGDPPPDPPPV